MSPESTPGPGRDRDATGWYMTAVRRENWKPLWAHHTREQTREMTSVFPRRPPGAPQSCPRAGMSPVTAPTMDSSFQRLCHLYFSALPLNQAPTFRADLHPKISNA